MRHSNVLLLLVMMVVVALGHISIEENSSSVLSNMKDQIDLLTSQHLEAKTNTCKEYYDRYNKEFRISTTYTGPQFNDLAKVDNFVCPLNIDSNKQKYDTAQAARIDALLGKLSVISRPDFSTKTKRTVDVSDYVNGHRCHLISWGTIRDSAVAALQRGELNDVFQLSRKLFVLADGKISSEFSNHRLDILNRLKAVCDYGLGKSGDVNVAHDAFLRLLSIMNSAIPNLRPGQGNTNSKIQEKYDFHVMNGHIYGGEHDRFHSIVKSGSPVTLFVPAGITVYNDKNQPINKAGGRFVYTSTGEYHTSEKMDYCVSWVKNI